MVMPKEQKSSKPKATRTRAKTVGKVASPDAWKRFMRLAGKLELGPPDLSTHFRDYLYGGKK